MRKIFTIILSLIILNSFQFAVKAMNWKYVYDLDGNGTNEVSVEVLDLIWKDGDEHILSIENDEKGTSIEVEPILLEEAKDYERMIIMDFKTDDSNNPYPEIESMTVSVRCPKPSGGWLALGKDYRLMYFNNDVIEDLTANIVESNSSEVQFTVDKLGEYVIYLNPGVYDLIFYADEPILTDEDCVLPEIYHEINGLRKEDVVMFPTIPEREGYVFTGWKAWSGSGIYYIDAQPIYGNRYKEYYASWCSEDEYEPINIEIVADEPITKGKENGKIITLKTNYGIFVKDDEFPAEWRTTYNLESNKDIKAEILSEWKSKWNIIGADDLIIETATRIDDKTVELTLLGNSYNKYSSAEIYIEFDSSLLMPEPYEIDGEIIDWDDTKIQIDEDGVRAKMYLSDNSVTIAKQKKRSGGSSVSKHTVSFETNGGEEIQSIRIANGHCLAEPEAPLRERYVFKAWYTDEELTEKYDFTSPVTKDFTLYAAWEKPTANESDNKQTIFPIKIIEEVIEFVKSVIR